MASVSAKSNAAFSIKASSAQTWDLKNYRAYCLPFLFVITPKLGSKTNLGPTFLDTMAPAAIAIR